MLIYYSWPWYNSAEQAILNCGPAVPINKDGFPEGTSANSTVRFEILDTSKTFFFLFNSSDIVSYHRRAREKVYITA